MYQWCRAVWIALVWSLAIGDVNAQSAPDLYAASVPVTEQSNAELQRAAGIGLREVLVRVSGQGDIVRNPALASALGDAQRYLDQYRYERNSINAPGALPLVAKLKFTQSGVAQLLRSAGLPVWASKRPTLLIWLVSDDGKERQFVDEQSAMAVALREQAQRRGLQLRFPKDFNAASRDDIWQMDATKLRADGVAMAGEVLLLGRVAQQSGRYVGAWTSVASGPSALTVEGDSLMNYAAASIDRIADALAQQYAVLAPNTGAAGVTLRVTGIESFNEYAALLAYLKQAGSIKSVDPLQVSGTEVLLRLRLDGSPEQLARQFSLDNRLLLESPESVGEAAMPQLNYRWQVVRG